MMSMIRHDGTPVYTTKCIERGREYLEAGRTRQMRAVLDIIGVRKVSNLNEAQAEKFLQALPPIITPRLDLLLSDFGCDCDPNILPDVTYATTRDQLREISTAWGLGVQIPEAGPLNPLRDQVRKALRLICLDAA